MPNRHPQEEDVEASLKLIFPNASDVNNCAISNPIESGNNNKSSSSSSPSPPHHQQHKQKSRTGEFSEETTTFLAHPSPAKINGVTFVVEDTREDEDDETAQFATTANTTLSNLTTHVKAIRSQSENESSTQVATLGLGDQFRLSCNIEQQFRSHSSNSQRHANDTCGSPGRFTCKSGPLSGGGGGGSGGHHKSHSRSLVTAPDGGWGWVVVFASFMISLIADGISFSFGIIFLELSQYFNESKSKTAFVGSLFMSIPLLVGPLASALTDRYGCRKITILSGVISCIGFILGHLSTCIEHLFIAFSIAGAGLALSYVTSIVIVAYYFEKRRSLATGLAVCGTGFGTFIFPPLTIHLLDEYTWRGTLLIMAGFFLNIVVFGALMRDVPGSGDLDTDSDSSLGAESFSRESLAPVSRARLATLGDSPNGLTSGCSPQLTPATVATGGSSLGPKKWPGVTLASPRMTSSMVHIPTFLTHRGSTCDNQEVLNELWSRKGGYLSRLIERYPQIVRPVQVLSPLAGRICPPHPPPAQPPPPPVGPPPHSAAAGSPGAAVVAERTDASSSVNAISPGTIGNSDSFNNNNNNNNCTLHNNNNNNININSNINNNNNNNHEHDSINQTEPSIKSPALTSTQSIRSPRIIAKRLSCNPAGYRLNSLIPFEHGSQARKLQRGSITYRSAILNIRRYRVRSSSCPDMVAVAARVTETSPPWLSDVKDFFHDVIDISIFRSLKYSLFCFSNLLLYACIDVPYVYIPDHAIMSGSSDKEQASFLISLVGMVNTAGIVFVGYIGDYPCISPALLYSLAICLSGLSIFLIPLIESYSGLAVLSSMYGLTISANYALVSVILVDLISLDKFTIGYGLLLLVQGIASLIGPPLAGWLCDQTGSYSVTFFATGICIFLSGAIVLPVSSSSRVCVEGEETAKPAPAPAPGETVQVTVENDTGDILKCASDPMMDVTNANLHQLTQE